MHSTPDQTSPDHSGESPLVERMREQVFRDQERAEIAAGLTGPGPDLAQPLLDHARTNISVRRARLEAGGLSSNEKEGLEIGIEQWTEDVEALKQVTETGKMNPEAKKHMERFCGDLEEFVTDVVEGNDAWIDRDRNPLEARKLRKHYQSVAKDLIRRGLSSKSE